ncbi:MAG: methionyl-tRNA formyltransferase [Thermodesulfobacteriota bacterium]
MTPAPFHVIFMGTPDFAVPALEALHDFGCRVDLVVTQPDRPRGRGRKLSPPPVKQAAEKLGYPIVQPSAVNTDAFYDTVSSLQPDLMVVVAFGHILPKRILEIPRLAPVNLHASLLPRYRGPAPIQWAIIEGAAETGVTAMLMDKGLDTGEMLASKATPIDPDDTAGSLHDRLAEMAAHVLLETLHGFSDGTIRPVPQNHAEATYAPMLTKTDGHVDWHQPAEKIERIIRGMSPWPGAYTFMGQMRLKLFAARVAEKTEDKPPGTVIRGFDNELRVAAGADAVSITRIQGASGKRLDIADFLKGTAVPVGTVLS